MGKVKGKHRLDKYYHLAKEHGYRSRAAWKLVQLDSKFSFLRSSQSVLDLCAAPGGWMQVAVERVPVGSLVIGVDLDPIRPIRGAIAVQDDITTPKCRATLKKLMTENGCRTFDLVLHDGSPNVGGAWAKEATSQNALVIDSVKLAAELLSPKGTFVTKVFRSQDYSAVLYCLRQLFEKVEVDKPLASRSASAEIYIVGFKYKAPAKIDPRLLDFKHLFQGGKEPPKVIDVLRVTKQKRHRDGYEDGASILRKVCSAVDFIWSEAPLDILGSVTSISFDDPACLPIREHTLTTEEVKALCDDLRILGKQDFKHILKWRMHIRKALSPSEKSITPSISVEPESKEDEDEKILNEMEELTFAIERKKKKEKRLQAKRQAKEKARKALGVQIDATGDGYGDQDLFSLSSIKGKKDLVAVDNDEYLEPGEGNSEDSESDAEAQEDTSSDVDSEEERRRYDEKVEELLDEAYESYVARVEGKTKQRKRTKRAYEKDDELLEGDNDDAMVHSDQDTDNDQGEHELNPLVVPLEDAPTQEEIAAQWFNQDVFAEPDEQDILDKYDSDDEMQIDEPGKSAKKSRQMGKDASEKQTIGVTRKTKSSVLQVPSSEAAEDFEIVPAPPTDSSDSSSSDDSDEDDINNKAEILAYAKKMLTKKQREEMLDDAYNKYMFHDEGLPKWFADEEIKHRQPIKPITKEEVAAMRAQFKEIDARPAKKVAEAKARKKRAAHRKLEKIRRKANSISDQADISDRSKTKMIDQLYKKVGPKKPEREYVVAKKGVQVRAGKGKVLVDRRMKKDARKNGINKKGKGKNGKQKGKGSMKAKGKKGEARQNSRK
nr:putative rRNA methyltransferase [Ipomoea batatas]GMD85740.1 putative rRNA methyltransferase [Ipomoea batatas]